MATTEQLQGHPAPSGVEPCPACGAPVALDQRYCLNCGMRRLDHRVMRGAAEAVQAPPEEAPRRPASTGWTPTTALIGAGVIVVVLGVGVLIGHSLSGSKTGSGHPQVITVGGVAAGAGTQAAASGSGGGGGGGGAFKSDWPAGKTGYTIALQTLPNTAPASAVAAAEASA